MLAAAYDWSETLSVLRIRVSDVGPESGSDLGLSPHSGTTGMGTQGRDHWPPPIFLGGENAAKLICRLPVPRPVATCSEPTRLGPLGQGCCALRPVLTPETNLVPRLAKFPVVGPVFE